MTLTINSIAFRYSVHATEDEEKNSTAFKTILPLEMNKGKVVKEKVSGGYNNPIIYNDITITKKEEIEQTLEYFKENISDIDKKNLYLEFEDRFDEDNKTFHFRIDKGLAYNGIVSINDSPNFIKVTIKLTTFDRDTSFKEFIMANGLILN